MNKLKYKLWSISKSDVVGFEVASVGLRLLALLFDFFVGIVFFIVVTIPVETFDNLSTRAVGIFGGLVIFSIRAFFQGNSGQSLGQKIFKIRVSGENSMNYSDALIRNFICFVFVSIPLAGLVLLINTSVNKNRQGWHDRAARTQILKKK